METLPTLKQHLTSREATHLYAICNQHAQSKFTLGKMGGTILELSLLGGGRPAAKESTMHV